MADELAHVRVHDVPLKYQEALLPIHIVKHLLSMVVQRVEQIGVIVLALSSIKWQW